MLNNGDGLSGIGLLGQQIARRYRGLPDLSIAQDILAATIFLYPTVEAAENGDKLGGSGVFVGAPFDDRADLFALYAVTNWHVACNGGHSVIRCTDRNGQTKIIETDPIDWEFIPSGPDLAIWRMKGSYDVTFVPVVMFAANEQDDIFIGEDVFMVGRFVDFDGKTTNRPALRFGAVSLLNGAIKQPTGSSSPSHIVDMHSRTGYSGSPVYAYRPSGVVNPSVQTGIGISSDGTPPTRRKWGDGTQTMLKLLGIQWGQFPEVWEVKGKAARPAEEAVLVTDGQFVSGFSGMSCVVPAHQILRLLNIQLFRDERRNAPPEAIMVPMPEIDYSFGPVTLNLETKTDEL